MPPGSSSRSVPADGSKALQDRLHELLSRLATTVDVVKNWPEAKGDDASIHVERTTKLIESINEVIGALQRVEGVVKKNQILRKSLQSCLIPLDLLDLLDHGGGLNPDCFSRGLLREALGQLAGLKRRKLALEMLGSAVQAGLCERIAAAKVAEANSTSKPNATKREREDASAEDDGEIKEPPSKKRHGAT